MDFISILFYFIFVKGLFKQIVQESSDDETSLFDDKVFIHYIGSLT